MGAPDPGDGETAFDADAFFAEHLRSRRAAAQVPRAARGGRRALPRGGLRRRRQPRRGRGDAARPRALLGRGPRGPRQRAPAHPVERRPPAAREVPQDPRPAVRAEADGGARGRHHRARQPLHRRVRRPRRVPLHQRVRGAVPVVGVPRSDGPAVGGARHPAAPEGRHHAPERGDPVPTPTRPRKIRRRDRRRRSTRTSRRSSTNAPANPATTSSRSSSRSRSTASA